MRAEHKEKEKCVSSSNYIRMSNLLHQSSEAKVQICLSLRSKPRGNRHRLSLIKTDACLKRNYFTVITRYLLTLQKRAGSVMRSVY